METQKPVVWKYKNTEHKGGRGGGGGSRIVPYYGCWLSPGDSSPNFPCIVITLGQNKLCNLINICWFLLPRQVACWVLFPWFYCWPEESMTDQMRERFVWNGVTMKLLYTAHSTPYLAKQACGERYPTMPLTRKLLSYFIQTWLLQFYVLWRNLTKAVTQSSKQCC